MKAEEREGSVRKVPIFLFSTDFLLVQRDFGEGDMRGLLEVRTEKGKPRTLMRLSHFPFITLSKPVLLTS